MAANRNGVEGRMSARTRLLLGTLTFFLTASIAYSFVASRTASSVGNSMASAEIHQKSSPLPDPAQIIERLLSDEHLARSLEQIRSSSEPVPNVQELHEAVAIEPLEPLEPESRWFRVTVRDSDPSQAIALANSLVQQYADEEHARLESTIWNEYRVAQQATQQAYQTWVKVSQQWKPQEGKKPEAITLSEPPRESKVKENPQLIALSEQLSTLIRRRTEMLGIRTRSHPEIKALEREILAIERQKAAIPNMLPERISPSVDPDGPSYVAENPNLERAYHAAWDNLQKVKQKEQEAEQQMEQNPDVELILATQTETDWISKMQPMALIVALTLGLFATIAMSTAFGKISNFQASDKPFSSPEEIESVLSIPVLGRIRSPRDE